MIASHSFSVPVAEELGSVDEAIMLEHIAYWTLKNEANDKNFFDGKYWSYNATKGFLTIFPYWTEKQVRRILNSLIKRGYIITGNYNETPYDRTLWYTLSEKGKSIFPNGQMEVPERVNGDSQMGKSKIPNGQIENPKRANQKSQMGSCIICTDINLYKPDINQEEEPPISPFDKGEPVSPTSCDLEPEPIKKAKKPKPSPFSAFAGEHEKLHEALNAFAEMRKSLKKPLTERAQQLIIGRLQQASSNTDVWITMLDKATLNSWQSIYELKPDELKKVLTKEESDDEWLRKLHEEWARG